MRLPVSARDPHRQPGAEFQRGSLLDTIVRLEAESGGQLWEQALREVGEVAIADDGSALAKVRTEVRARVERFLSLADGPGTVDVKVSELTREHLREVLRLFPATQPGVHGVPFNRLSTGSLNLLVFALLTYIAELKGGKPQEDTEGIAADQLQIAMRSTALG